VAQIAGFSGHADAPELVTRARQLRHPPKQTWVVHGEPEAADSLRCRIWHEPGRPVRVPGYGETVTV